MTKQELMLQNMFLQDEIKRLKKLVPLTEDNVRDIIAEEFQFLSVKLTSKGFESLGLNLTVEHGDNVITQDYV